MNHIKEIGGGILLIHLPVHHDVRGSFFKLMDNRVQQISSYTLCQLNYVTNKNKFTLRGLHYQKEPFAESKIFRVLTGVVQVVAFNIRHNSPFYKETFTYNLERPDEALLVPKGFATGYCTLENNTAVLYSSDMDYHPEFEAGLRWNDPAVKIANLSFEHLITSDKDRQWQDFE